VNAPHLNPSRAGQYSIYLSPEGWKAELTSVDGYMLRCEYGETDTQEIVMTGDDLGVTQVDGLGSKDLDRVRSLALIDLTALFDMYDITYVRRKAKGRGKGRWLCSFAISDAPI